MIKFTTRSGAQYIIDDAGETLTRLAEHPVISERTGEPMYEIIGHMRLLDIKLLEEGRSGHFELDNGPLRTTIIDKIESF